MNHNGRNWYSTNSLRTYQRTIAKESLRSQLSDNGRYPLGSFCDHDNCQMRELIIKSVSDKTLQNWEDFRKDMREKCLLGKRSLGLPPVEIECRFRTYPIKKHTEDVFDIDMQVASDASQQSKHEYDRSKYVLNRKVKSVSAMSPIGSPQSTTESALSDLIFVDDRQPSCSNVRWVISEKENNSEKHVSSSDHYSKQQHMRITTQAEKPLVRPASINTFQNSPTLNTHLSSVNTAPECILNKYGHCFASAICPFAHHGVIKKIEGKKASAPIWHRKPPHTPMCPGFLNFQCWNHECEKRHIVYPSDNV